MTWQDPIIILSMKTRKKDTALQNTIQLSMTAFPLQPPAPLKTLLSDHLIILRCQGAK